MKIMQNGDITLKDVFVSEEDRIPGVKAFQDINEVSKYCVYQMHFIIRLTYIILLSAVD